MLLPCRACVPNLWEVLEHGIGERCMIDSRVCDFVEGDEVRQDESELMKPVRNQPDLGIGAGVDSV